MLFPPLSFGFSDILPLLRILPLGGLAAVPGCTPVWTYHEYDQNKAVTENESRHELAPLIQLCIVELCHIRSSVKFLHNSSL